ncbi:leucine-rich repeat protein [Prochlorococcus sp. MIT 1303]|uniref:leucine-rich repeat protein n=1 Tax=Prochlorococcus sp. MIT 1303 TaxID=1723647 RepID=UPI0007B3B40F|nr:leucine-rich repeat protein [Prochlorococcus sp. MIT 1303]KZR67732.1 RTX-I toxin determinant A from serotypes 1/9 [Prochlorococcus sp. MIT 1303]
MTNVLTPEHVAALIDAQNHVIIPNSFTSIGDYAFHGTNLTSVEIPNSVTSIGVGAFHGTRLTSVDIGNSVTSIGDYAFAYTQLASLKITDSVTSIGNYAFQGTLLTEIEIPDSVTSIGVGAFHGIKLTSVDIGNSVTSIGDFAFAYTELASLKIPDSVTSIGNYAFHGTLLTEIEIPDSVASIGNYAFKDTQLTIVEIPDSVTSIGNGAFAGTQLTSIDVPEGIEIAANAFDSSVQITTRVSGGNFLELGYSLKGNDDTGNPGGDAQALGVDASGLTNVAVLGPNTSENKTYTLEITAESLKNGWDLEAADIVLKYDTKLFETIDLDDIQIGGDLPISNAVDIDDDNGLIRIAAASLSNLGTGDSIDDEALFASIKVDFDESYFEDSERSPDANGKFTFDGNPLGFELSANSDETVFSRTFKSDIDGNEIAGGAYTNREIKSLGDLNGGTSFDEGDVNLYQAEIKFQEQGDGLIFGTKRVIGSDIGFTNLIREGDLVTAKTTIDNISNSLAKDVVIEDAGNVDGASFVRSHFLNKTSNGTATDIDNSVAQAGAISQATSIYLNSYSDFYDKYWDTSGAGGWKHNAPVLTQDVDAGITYKDSWMAGFDSEYNSAYNSLINVDLAGGVFGSVNTIQGGAGNDNIMGGAGNDTIQGGAGNDTIMGGAGNDNIQGGAGNDILNGDAGADTIQGGAGNDTLIGGAGADRFINQTTVALNGADNIYDFNIAQGDNFTFDFGETGGLANQAALRGTGVNWERRTALQALGANTGFVVVGEDIANEDALEIFAEGLGGEHANDVVYFITSTDVDANAPYTLYSVTYFGASNAATNLMVTTGNQTLNDFAAAQITQFTNVNATPLATFEGVSDATSLSASGAFAGILNDAQLSDFPYDPSSQESTEIEIDMRITGNAGDIVDLTKGLFKVSADNTQQNPDPNDHYYTSNKGSKNLITFQGDLNYDGRVSMKDLAYLNAGAARQQTTTENPTGEDLDSNGVVDASVAHDVDADYSGKIDLNDLAILDRDWGETLHTGSETFTGSGDLSWDELDSQGTNATWDNDAFKDQNEIEASSDYIGSLESPTANGVIGADGNTTANDEDMQGTEFQDPLTV